MGMARSAHLFGWLLAAALVSVVSGQTQRPGPQQPGVGASQPARDTPAQKADAPAQTGTIGGRVIAADTGRPVRRARVSVSAVELPGGRGTLTDDSGVFELAELPAGRYTVSVSKSGFVSLSYGQRRPLQAGTPLQLAEGQQFKDIEFRLPRGSVIAGHVFDESGDPMPGIMVRVLRYQYQQGDRRLVPAGTAQTDDQGQYRVWGLNPGEYYVDAQARINFGFGGGPPGRGGAGGPGGRGGIAGVIAGVVGSIAGSNVATLFGNDDDSQKAYAPTYFPGVTAISEARPVTVGLSQESSNIDFSLQLVRVSRIAGKVSEPDGTAAWAGNVTLVADAATVGRGGGFGINYGSRIDWDGSFEINNVPPGRYTLQARGPNDDVVSRFASQPLGVAGGDIDNVTVVLEDGASLTGSVSFPRGSTDLPDLTQVRISTPSTDQSIGGAAQGRVDKDANFTITGVQAGAHLIRANGQLRGWRLSSITINGRDVTDVPLQLRAGEKVSNVLVTFTDKTTEINGALTTTQGAPVTEYTVLAFSTDMSFWQAQSRHIATARPDQTGKFRIRGLPPGNYYLATVDPSEQGEWFEPAYLDEHRLGATRVSLGDGETKTQDFRIRTQ
jgi:hypothetical protein